MLHDFISCLAGHAVLKMDSHCCQRLCCSIRVIICNGHCTLPIHLDSLPYCKMRTLRWESSFICWPATRMCTRSSYFAQSNVHSFLCILSFGLLFWMRAIVLLEAAQCSHSYNVGLSKPSYHLHGPARSL